MVGLIKPEVILTHESDLDGFIAGVLLRELAQKLFSEDIPLEAYHYHTWRQRDMSEKSAWVADLAFETRLDKPNWLIIDHHPFDRPPRQARLIHDTQKSASLLCYELCQAEGIASPKLTRLVHLSNVADLFLEADPDFALANDYANLVKTYQFWNLHALVEGNLEALLDHPLLEVMAVKRRVEDPLGLAWSRANVTELSPHVGYVETVIGNNNLIVHQLLETNATTFPVLLTLFRKNNGTVVASLRSRDGSALRVAERLQGGGHPNACGATLPRSIRTIAEAVPYLRQVLNDQPRGPALNSLNDLFAALDAKK